MRIRRTSLALGLICGITWGGGGTLAQTSGVNSDLKVRLAALAKSGNKTASGARIAATNFLNKLYSSTGFKVAWSNPANVEALKSAVSRSWEDGLLPSDFHFSHLTSPATGTSDDAAIDRDLIMSDALARLLYQLYFGKVSPNALDPNWNFSRPVLSSDPVQIVADALAQGKVQDLIDKARLKHPLYAGLKASLQAYTQIAASGGWTAMPDGPAIKPGAQDPRLAQLRARLAVTGEYAGGTVAATDTYDESLATAVRLFQANHGLEPDGVLGTTTREALNVPPRDRVDQIRVNLERARWILRPLGDEMVVVNIAGQYLHLVFGGKRVWTTRVIVGKDYNKTPIFTEAMKTVVFNPDWTVPRSIVKNEIFPKAAGNPGYLAAHEYSLTSGSGPIDAATVNWSSYTGATFPYGVVQKPGPRNALGQVKFLFPNKYSVYLHDTPGRQLFEKSERSLSHGCIRVQDPLKLAEFILGNRLGWNRAKIDAAVAGKKLLNVSLPNPLPVLLLYWTFDPSFDGGGHFYRDIYGRDKRLLTALNAEFSPAAPAVAKAAPPSAAKNAEVLPWNEPVLTRPPPEN